MLCPTVPLCVFGRRIPTRNQGTKPTPAQNNPGHIRRTTIPPGLLKRHKLTAG